MYLSFFFKFGLSGLLWNVKLWTYGLQVPKGWLKVKNIKLYIKNWECILGHTDRVKYTIKFDSFV